VTQSDRSDQDILVRNQFHIFDRASSEIAAGDDVQRRILLLSRPEWSEWMSLRYGGPVPAEPALPVMLRRLGAATHRLTRMAERMRTLD
jgi:hypothetical protein